MIITPAQTWEDLRPPSNDERRAEWSAQYYSLGLHRLYSESEHYARQECLANQGEQE